MIHIGSWAREFAVAPVLGLDPDLLNDDRVARAPDALAPVQQEEVTGSVAVSAIASFGVDVTQIHWDMTSISLHGDYAEVDGDFPQPKFGHPKDRRPDLKQVQAGIASAADGAVPVFWQPYSGGAAEISQVVGAMEGIRRVARPRKFLLIGDTKLLSYDNIAAMVEAKVTFLAPASKNFVPAEVLATCDYAKATPVAYVAQRDAHLDEHERGRYRAIEDTITIATKPETDPKYTVRRIFVHSSARAQAAVHARTKKLDRARDDLGRLSRRLGSRHYPTPEAVTARITTIARERHVGDYLRTTVGTDNGRPTLDWHFDHTTLDAETATDGRYALLTNLPKTITTAQVMARHKNQPATSERRYHDFKKPLAVAPMFLHTNRRISALIGVACLALLIYCLIEREARRNLTPDIKLDGLYPGRAAKPTAGLIFTTPAPLRLRTTTDRTHETRSPDGYSNASSTCSKPTHGAFHDRTDRVSCANCGASRRRPPCARLYAARCLAV